MGKYDVPGVDAHLTRLRSITWGADKDWREGWRSDNENGAYLARLIVAGENARAFDLATKMVGKMAQEANATDLQIAARDRMRDERAVRIATRRAADVKLSKGVAKCERCRRGWWGVVARPIAQTVKREYLVDGEVREGLGRYGYIGREERERLSMEGKTLVMREYHEVKGVALCALDEEKSADSQVPADPVGTVWITDRTATGESFDYGDPVVVSKTLPA